MINKRKILNVFLIIKIINKIQIQWNEKEMPSYFVTNNYLLISWIETKSNGKLKSNAWISKRNTMSQY